MMEEEPVQHRQTDEEFNLWFVVLIFADVFLAGEDARWLDRVPVVGDGLRGLEVGAGDPASTDLSNKECME